MTSILPHKYKRLPCDEIYIPRSSRQRTSMDTSDLDQSIFERGVLQPIIVRPSNEGDETDLSWVIVAGERRLQSSIKQGILDIPARLGSELSTLEWELIELEENIKRQNLSWQDEIKAVLKLHTILASQTEEWTGKNTAGYIGLSEGAVTKMLRVAKDIDNPRIKGAEGYNPAYNILSRIDERRNTDIVNSIIEAGAGAFNLPVPPAPVILKLSPDDPDPEPLPEPIFIPPPESILNLDFLEWAPTYAGPRFNFIHMDPPYGVEVFAGNMSGRNAHDTYADEADVYWKIMRCLCKNLDRLMTPSAHFMLWFSMEHYSATMDFFTEYAPSLNFSLFPLIWHKSDNVGILNDPKRGPRRVYETALMASREDHLIVRSTSNVYAAPTDKLYHPSTKPEPMLRYFFQMFVDESTNLLDPTCGSGSALRAAESLGAASVLGLERDPKHYAAAQTALKAFRNLRRASKG